MYLLQIQYVFNVFISEQSNYAWTSHCPVTRTDLASVVSRPFFVSLVTYRFLLEGYVLDLIVLTLGNEGVIIELYVCN